MDWQYAFNLAAGIVGATFGWLLKTLWGAVEHLRRDLNDLERGINSDFTRKEDFTSAMLRVESKLDRIFEILSEKADR